MSVPLLNVPTGRNLECSARKEPSKLVPMDGIFLREFRNLSALLPLTKFLRCLHPAVATSGYLSYLMFKNASR